MAKQEIIPIRVTRADRVALRAAAGAKPVSTWLRELGLEEARRQSSVRTVARLMDEALSSGSGLDEEEADLLADEAKHASREVRRK
ncbi:MAG: hypothetical protein WCS72_15535 [Deltaproteobacteria bacterium]